jgi:hypothetical protein
VSHFYRAVYPDRSNKDPADQTNTKYSPFLTNPARSIFPDSVPARLFGSSFGLSEWHHRPSPLLKAPFRGQRFQSGAHRECCAGSECRLWRSFHKRHRTGRCEIFHGFNTDRTAEKHEFPNTSAPLSVTLKKLAAV